jgi:hypothetical protein
MVAELSLSHIYARAAGDVERTLAQRIGTGDPLLSQDELVNIVSAPLGVSADRLHGFGRFNLQNTLVMGA